MPFWTPAFSTDPFQALSKPSKAGAGLYPVNFDTRLLLNETLDLSDKVDAPFVIKRPQKETVES